MSRALAFTSFALVPLLAVACGDGGTSSSGGSAGSTTSTTTSGTGGGGAGGVGGGGTGGTGGDTAGGGAGGGTGGTGGGTGGAGECTPGDKEDCYTGPAPTLGVGICKSGKRTCNNSGSWGACIGQVTPLPETCQTLLDDDCDGAVNEEGAECVCVPGETTACYTGPMNTAGVGICAAGVGTCRPDGLGYDDCVGEVLPALETCLAPTDEDCDGAAPACTGTDQWHKGFGDAGAQTAADVAAWNGGAVICGTFTGAVDFGGGPFVSGGGNDAFVASYDYLGGHMWSKRFGDVSPQVATSVAVDLDGNVIVVGDNSGKMDPGGGTITAVGLTDVFIAKYDVFGNFLWGKEAGDSKAQNALAVAAAAGRVAMAGKYQGKMDFGAGLLTAVGSTDGFVAVFEKDGTAVWSKSFGDAAAQAVKAVAIGPMGEVIIAGDNTGTIDLGNGPHTTAGGNDAFLAAFDKDGAPLWSKQLGDNFTQLATGLAVDDAGNIVLSVTYTGTINFGGGPLTSTGSNDIGLAKFTTGGMFLWGKKLGGTGSDNARSVAIDPFGGIAFIGDFTGTVDFGGGPLTSAGSTDVVIARFDAFGDHLWSHRAGDTGAQTGAGVSADATGVSATGTFSGPIDFGGGAIANAGGTDVFVVKLSQ